MNGHQLTAHLVNKYGFSMVNNGYVFHFKEICKWRGQITDAPPFRKRIHNNFLFELRFPIPIQTS